MKKLLFLLILASLVGCGTTKIEYRITESKLISGNSYLYAATLVGQNYSPDRTDIIFPSMEAYRVGDIVEIKVSN